MQEHDKKISEISELKEKLVCCFKACMDAGIEKMDTAEAGQVADMIKDLAEAEEKCWKACYYKSIVESMDEARTDEEEELPWYLEALRGYNPSRYKSSGRYASKGHGTRMGYVDGMPRDNMPLYPNPRMGYVAPQSWDSPDGISKDWDGRYGEPYNKYKMARRHYTETHSQSDKAEMSDRAVEHMNDTFETIRDIWHDADPDLRKRMKSDVTKLLNEMG